MQFLIHFFSVKTVFFTVLDYPLSYIEFFGTVFNIASVVLVAKNRIANWPAGIIGTFLFLALFYQINLYADFFEQIYFIVTGFYGWWLWTKNSPRAGQVIGEAGGASGTRWSRKTGVLFGIAVTVMLSIVAGYGTSELHIWSPHWFPEKASFPYLDATTTIMSFTATLLLAHRRIEAWIYWIVVDVAGIGLYYMKGMKFVALLYVVFLILASNGLRQWRREADKSTPE